MICNSGGAIGADFVFGQEGEKRGVKIIDYSFAGHNTKSKNQVILTKEELDDGFEHIKIANKTLKRNTYNLKPYVKNLLSRNWFQAKNSETIFAVALLQLDRKSVTGGTGWCCQFGVDNKKEVYVFDQNLNSWFKFSYVKYEYQKIDYIPELTETFAGVGTRDINENGIKAIKELFKNKFDI